MTGPAPSVRSGFLALLLFAAAALTLWALGLILAPFLLPIAWALCLVTLTGGIYRRLAARTRHPRLSAVLMTVLVAVVVVGPLLLLGGVVVREAITVSSSAAGALSGAKPSGPAAAAEGAEEDAWEKFFREHPRIARARDRIDDQLKTFNTDLRTLKNVALQQLGEPFAKGALGFLKGFLSFAFGFLVTLATLYFLYRDGEAIRSVVIDLVPLEEEDTRHIIDTLASTAFAAILGGLLSAIVQGTLGGIALGITGASAPVLLGFVMAVLSLLPVGGTAFVWAPAAFYYFAMEQTWKGWFLLLWGVFVIGASDNFFRPWLMRKAGAHGIHPLLLFFAILSGIGLFGISGVVFGPLLVTVVLGVVRIYRDHYGKRAGRHPEAAPAPPPPA